VDGLHSQVQGFIPTGWYPTAARALPDGRVALVSGRGLRSYANPSGPSPMKVPARSHEGIRSDEYVGKIQSGSVAFVDAFSPQQLDAHSKVVMANSPYRDSLLDDVRLPATNPIPSRR